jgi:thioredoxin-related protein
LPSLEKLHQDFLGKDFVIIGIDIQENRNQVLRQVQKFALSYENLLDENNEVSDMYGVRSTPAKIIIDTKGNVVGAALGYREWDDPGVKQLIRSLIAAGH